MALTLFPGLEQALAQLALVLGVGSKREGSGSWSRPERPKRRSKSSVVLKIAAPKRERPDSSIRPRSARVCTADSEETPRIRATSGRETGCR